MKKFVRLSAVALAVLAVVAMFGLKSAEAQCKGNCGVRVAVPVGVPSQTTIVNDRVFRPDHVTRITTVPLVPTGIQANAPIQSPTPAPLPGAAPVVVSPPIIVTPAPAPVQSVGCGCGAPACPCVPTTVIRSSAPVCASPQPIRTVVGAAAHLPSNIVRAVSVSVAQSKADRQAAENRMRHVGGSFGNGRYEGVGFSTRSADEAIRSCCYWGQRTPVDIGVARGPSGWYACVLYR